MDHYNEENKGRRLCLAVDLNGKWQLYKGAIKLTLMNGKTYIYLSANKQ